MTRPHHPTKAHSLVQWWPFRKFASIVIAFGVVLLVAIAVEWRLLQRTHVGLPVAAAAGKMAVAADESFFLDSQRPVKRESKTVYSKGGLPQEAREPGKASMARPPTTPPPAKHPSPPRNKNTGQESRMETHVKENIESYEMDSLCGGCRSLNMEHLKRGLHEERCGTLIYQTARESNPPLTILQAAQKVSQNYTDCASCLKCQAKDKLYWRYDRAAPAISNAKTHYFASIPEQDHRIPTSILNSATQNLTQYFESLNQKGQAPKQYLFEYNPSIVPLPDHMSFPSYLQQQNPVYLASFRVATTQGCFSVDATLQMIGGAWESDHKPKKKDYLGLALLREDLSVVEEAIIDLPRPFRKREDFRLFVLHNQLFVASYCKITPIWIYHQDDETKYDEITFHGNQVQNWKATNVFPSDLRVRIGAAVTQCAKEPNDNKHFKNLNYFINKNGETMVELFPLGPHVVRPVHHVLNASASVPGREDDISHDHMPYPSFYTMEEPLLAQEYDFFEPPFTQDRGGACCIAIPDPREPSKMLWLGVSHAKTPHARRKLKDKLKSNQYLSRWYAFEQEDPYKIVAVSGFFCLSSLPGNDATNTEAMKENPLMAHAAATTAWRLGSMSLNCPVIHFVTGMTEKVNDSSKLIIAYGVGDCTSWFVEVTKADVIQIIFAGPKQ